MITRVRLGGRPLAVARKCKLVTPAGQDDPQHNRGDSQDAGGGGIEEQARVIGRPEHQGEPGATVLHRVRTQTGRSALKRQHELSAMTKSAGVGIS